MMRRSVLALTWLCLLVTGAAAKAGVNIENWTTGNGARVYFVETHQIPMVQFALGFGAGSARDPAGALGLANMVASMLEEGAADLDAASVSTAFDAVGADYSAGSGRDISIFKLRSLSDTEILDQSIAVFRKLVSQPTFPEDAIERVRERILVGLERNEQSPRSVASRAFYNALYRDHPYSHSPRGVAQTVARITRQDLVDFHRRYYVGRNAVIVIVGALDSKRAKARAAEIVHALPPGSEPQPLAEVPDVGTPGTIDIDFPSSQTHLLMGQNGIDRIDPDFYALYVGNHILGGNGLISRLATDIREDRGLAYSVYSAFVPMKRRGPFAINLQTRNDQADLAEELSLETLRRFIERGPDPEELAAAKGNIIGGFPLRLSSNAKIADSVLDIAFYGLPLDYLDEFPQRIADVTLEHVNSAFRRRIVPERFVRVRVGGG